LPIRTNCRNVEAIVAPAAESSGGTLSEAPRARYPPPWPSGGPQPSESHTAAEQRCLRLRCPRSSRPTGPASVDEAPSLDSARSPNLFRRAGAPAEVVTDSAASLRAATDSRPILALSLLEMQFRRLLTCPPLKLSEADRAPVGPGVLLLSDSDLSTYYYVEPCQTLRIAIGGFLRSSASRRGSDSIKPRLAEHLGMPKRA